MSRTTAARQDGPWAPSVRTFEGRLASLPAIAPLRWSAGMLKPVATDIESLKILDKRLRWLAAWTIHHANHIRPSDATWATEYVDRVHAAQARFDAKTESRQAA